MTTTTAKNQRATHLTLTSHTPHTHKMYTYEMIDRNPPRITSDRTTKEDLRNTQVGNALAFRGKLASKPLVHHKVNACA